MPNNAEIDENASLLIVVAVALIDPSGCVLVQRRPEGKALAGLWEFPGGKVEPGESPEVALVRELAEELEITVNAAALRPAAFASTALDDRHLLLLLYICHRWEGLPQPIEADDIAWHRPSDLRALAMPPADAPLVEWLERTI